jgi:hypothetical protein
MARIMINLLVIAAIVLAATALIMLPRALDAGGLLADQDDPAAIADRKVARLLDRDTAEREIAAALAADDADLAESFLELARERRVAVAPELAEKVAKAVAEANSASRTAENFAKGLVIGEPDDIAGFAGMALGDLFVFGDVRDAVREGSRLATGEEADRLVLGLACVGLAVTAGTYATLGSGAPVRMGLTVAKAARKTGRLSAGLAEWLGRSLRDVVDWGRFRTAIAGASLTQPALAIRAAREAVKLDKAGAIIDVVRDVGRVQSKAGTQAALDGLKIAQGPADVARVAKLAEKKGKKTRAVLKLLGRGAIVLAAGAFNLALWILSAVLSLFGFLTSTKGAVERYTMRRLQRRKAQRLAAREQEVRNRRLAAVALGQTSRA